MLSLLLTSLTAEGRDFEQLYVKAMALGLLGGFIARNKTNHNSDLLTCLCSQWSLLVKIAARYNVQAIAPLSRRPPTNIEGAMYSLLQVLMNCPNNEIQYTDMNFDVSCCITGLLDMMGDVMSVGSKKGVTLSPLSVETPIIPPFIKTLSTKVTADCSLPLDSSDINDQDSIKKSSADVKGSKLLALCTRGHAMIKATGASKDTPTSIVSCTRCALTISDSDAKVIFLCLLLFCF